MKICVNGDDARGAGRGSRSPSSSRMCAERRRDGRGVAVAVDAEVVPRSEWEQRRAGRGSAGRGAAARSRADDGGCSRLSRSRAARWRSRLIVGTGGFRSLDVMERGDRGIGRRDRDRRAAAGRRRRRPARWSRCSTRAGLLPAAEHRRLLHGPRRRADGAHGARGVRDRLGEARGDRRRPHAVPGPGRAARGGRDAGRGRLRRAAVHERRPDPGAAARGGRLRGGDAARARRSAAGWASATRTTWRSSSSRPACR